jgi:four helix bundle protein
MFDFERFPVYVRAEEAYELIVKQILRNKYTPLRLNDQLERASSSIVLNIAEGAAIYSKKDKKNYYLIARGSTQECVAALRLLKIRGTLTDEKFQLIYSKLEEIAKMLTGLIKKMLE